MWPLRLMVRTAASHAANTGSTPVEVIICPVKNNIQFIYTSYCSLFFKEIGLLTMSSLLSLLEAKSNFDKSMVLIVCKKSKYEILKEKNQNIFCEKEIIQAHNANANCLAKIGKILTEKKILFETCSRSELNHNIVNEKLIVVIGGDGTVLDVAQFVKKNIVIGINSDKKRSFGFFCVGDSFLFERMIENENSNIFSIQKLVRIAMIVNEKPSPYIALNEILITNKNPAATSRYEICIDGKRENHRSSGIWVSTAAGSTGAIASGGGQVQLLNDNRIQYRVREPCFSSNNSFVFLSGFIDKDGDLIIKSKMEDGCIYVDGPNRAIPFSFGSTVRITSKGEPFRLVANKELKDRRRVLLNKCLNYTKKT